MWNFGINVIYLFIFSAQTQTLVRLAMNPVSTVTSATKGKFLL